jgi:hypothetical protein
LNEQAPSAEKVPVKLELQPLEIDASEFSSYTEAYFEKLSHEMRQSCQIDIATIFNQMEGGYERHYMKIVDSEKQ